VLSELRAGQGRVRGVNQAQVLARPGLVRDGVETVPTLREEPMVPAELWVARRRVVSLKES